MASGICNVTGYCMNGGSCVTEGSNSYCACPVRYRGAKCESPTDDLSHETAVIALLSILGAFLITAIIVFFCCYWCQKKGQEDALVKRRRRRPFRPAPPPPQMPLFQRPFVSAPAYQPPPPPAPAAGPVILYSPPPISPPPTYVTSAPASSPSKLRLVSNPPTSKGTYIELAGKKVERIQPQVADRYYNSSTSLDAIYKGIRQPAFYHDDAVN